MRLSVQIAYLEKLTKYEHFFTKKEDNHPL
jgi:hypothetical protein